MKPRLKLDIIKAFDRLEWDFFLSVLTKNGMSGILTNFLSASFVNASSKILLNGRLTDSVRLTRSVRRGCPLSPLLFILTFDALGALLDDAIHRKAIVGVTFQDLALNTLHNLFADDVYLIIRAIMCYVLELQHILFIFG